MQTYPGSEVPKSVRVQAKTAVRGTSERTSLAPPGRRPAIGFSTETLIQGNAN